MTAQTTPNRRERHFGAVDHATRVAAARLRVAIDKQRGTTTPAWIRELAAEKDLKAS